MSPPDITQPIGLRSTTSIRIVRGQCRETSTWSMRSIAATRDSIATVSTRASGSPSRTAACERMSIGLSVVVPSISIRLTARALENQTTQTMAPAASDARARRAGSAGSDAGGRTGAARRTAPRETSDEVVLMTSPAGPAPADRRW